MSYHFQSQAYNPPLWQPGGHLQTIVPALSRKIKNIPPYQRERINTPDDDFLDLDWLTKNQDKLVIICHGLEGSSDRPYIMGMAKHLHQCGFDVLAVNYRGCSGKMNRSLRMYHSGATDDLDHIIQHAQKTYSDISLIGFSLGGNLILKYLGEQGKDTPIRKAVAFSVPLDLHDGVKHLDTGIRKIYVRRFLNTLRQKVLLKHQQYPDQIDISDLYKIRTLFDFDDCYTARIHGFEGATDYYHKCSSYRFVDDIKVPTLILNAKNDPMIGPFATSPDAVKNSESVTFHLTEKGGHCGYAVSSSSTYWSEAAASDYLSR